MLKQCHSWLGNCSTHLVECSSSDVGRHIHHSLDRTLSVLLDFISEPYVGEVDVSEDRNVTTKKLNMFMLKYPEGLKMCSLQARQVSK